MKVVVTGSTGFLGSNIITYCSSAGIESAALTRTCIIHETIHNFKPDVVIHCAWAGGNSSIDANSIVQFDNIQMSLNILESINRLDKKPKFVGVGSFAEYGKLYTKASENTIESPTTFYGLSKRMFKDISQMFCHQHNIPWLWIRPCYIYGPGDVSTRLIPKVINSIIYKNQISLNSCDTIIDYLYIDDFCSGVFELLNSDLQGVYNICSGQEYILKDIVNYIQKEMEDLDTINVNSHDTISQYICGSNKKLLDETKWYPQVPLNVGIQNTIKYYGNN